MNARRIYVASSWRNPYQQAVVGYLRDAGHAVYDVRNPCEGYDNPTGVVRGFQWSEIDHAWQSWTPNAYRAALDHPLSVQAFASDYEAMKWADTCVLVLPSGRSAHIEAGYFNGADKRLYILAYGENEPELMYKMATAVCLDLGELLQEIRLAAPPAGADAGGAQ
jgi:hypothetical protein